jgi:multidrug resistance efflux pump
MKEERLNARGSPRRRVLAAAAGVGAVVVAALYFAVRSPAAGSAAVSANEPPPTVDGSPTVTVSRGAFVRTLRVAGTVEALRSATVMAPRLAGQTSSSLVITRLVPAGTRVAAGDVLVEFDRQEQIRNAEDKRAEYLDLEEQIRKKQAEHTAARAADRTALETARNDVGRADLEMLKNEMLAPIEAEKNQLALEQAKARLDQLGRTMALKLRAAEAELRILEIRRDRARNAMRHAEANTERMSIRAPFDGLCVLKSVWKGNQMAEVQEGEEVRAGVPILDVVDPSAMRVRLRVSQADIAHVSAGQRARVELDAYPDLSFPGRIESLAPLAVASTLTPKVRSFVALVAIEGAHANLMPDLSAAVDLEIERRDNVLVLPRDAVTIESSAAYVRVRRGSSFERQPIELGAVSDAQVEIASGLREGATVARGHGPPR